MNDPASDSPRSHFRAFTYPPPAPGATEVAAGENVRIAGHREAAGRRGSRSGGRAAPRARLSGPSLSQSPVLHPRAGAVEAGDPPDERRGHRSTGRLRILHVVLYARPQGPRGVGGCFGGHRFDRITRGGRGAEPIARIRSGSGVRPAPHQGSNGRGDAGAGRWRARADPSCVDRAGVNSPLWSTRTWLEPSV